MVDELGDSHDWFHSISPLYGAKEKWFLIENHFSSARKVPHIELSPKSNPHFSCKSNPIPVAIPVPIQFSIPILVAIPIPIPTKF